MTEALTGNAARTDWEVSSDRQVRVKNKIAVNIKYVKMCIFYFTPQIEFKIF